MALGGSYNTYGVFEILDSSGKSLGRWDKDGLQLFSNTQQILMRINHGGLYLYDNTGQKVLAQLTSKGLNVYDGSIEGGFIKIGQNFQVDKNGNMTANNGKFLGGKIEIGKNFKVNEEGKMTASAATFRGDIKAGTININEKFKVDDKGNVSINGGTIKIGNNFNVDENGNLTARNGTFNGGEITIKGKRGDIFKTGIDEDGYQTVNIGGFRVWESGEGVYLGSSDQEVFIGDNEDMCFVTGWDGETYAHGDPEENLDNNKFGVVIDYNNVYAQEMYINNSIFDGSHYWGVGETIHDIYEGDSDGNAGLYDLTSRVEDLEHRIANLGGGE